MSRQNEIRLTGNVGMIEDVITKNEKELINMSLATENYYKGEKQDPDWHTLEVWGQNVERMRTLDVQKGSNMTVFGELKYDVFKDKNGSNHKRASILVRDFILHRNLY